MAYKQKKYIFPNAIEVELYHTARYGAPGQSRLKKKKPTPEQIEKINQYNKEKNCRHKLRQHFDVNDYFTTLTYIKEKRPADMEEAKRHFREFIRYVRKEYRKREKELKWIRNIECGTKGAWHIHMVINRIPETDMILAQGWQYGHAKNVLLYDRGEFKDLAAYMTKTPKTDTRLKEASYSASRNLPLPDPEVKIYRRFKTWKEEPQVPAGWSLEKDSFFEGENPVTGYKFRVYTLLRNRRATE